MLPRMLSVMLIALAMLAAPLTMRQSMAMAAVPAASQHHVATEMAAGNHCDQQGSSDQDQSGKAAGGNCCIATCVAVVVPAGAADLPAFHSLAPRPGSDARRLSYLGEIATPPPRRA